jgi:hypothetical protein
MFRLAFVRRSEPVGTALKGDAKKAIAGNAQITLMLKTAAGKSGQSRYKK